MCVQIIFLLLGIYGKESGNGKNLRFVGEVGKGLKNNCALGTSVTWGVDYSSHQKGKLQEIGG